MTLLKLYEEAEQNGIEVDCFSLKKVESLSLMDEDGICHIAIDPFQLTSTADETVKLAHELGHCRTGSFYTRSGPLDLRSRLENRADKWAIRKLITSEDLSDAVADGCTEIWQLAEYFNVTEDFARKAVSLHTRGSLTSA